MVWCANACITMKSALFVASLLLNASFLSVAVNKCYNCIENSWNACQRSQTGAECKNSLLGDTHCYSASGKYDNGTAVLDIVARGCIDCTDKDKACEKLDLMLAVTSYKLLSCNMACCSENRCNTIIPPTKVQSSSHPTLAVYSTATTFPISLMLFVTVVCLRLGLL